MVEGGKLRGATCVQWVSNTTPTLTLTVSKFCVPTLSWVMMIVGWRQESVDASKHNEDNAT